MLRIGLLVDGPESSKYIADLVRWAAENPAVTVTHRVVLERPRTAVRFRSLLSKLADPARVSRALAMRLLNIIVYSESRILRRNPLHKGHFSRIDLSDIVPAELSIRCSVSPSGLVVRALPGETHKLRDAGIDLLIRCGSGILRGELLSACRFGVLSFHHGDNRVNRGGPPGFWECYLRWPQTGFVIQRLTDELDGGEVLFRGGFATQYNFALNQADLFLKANRYLKDLLGRIAAEDALPPRCEEPGIYSNKLYRHPTVGQVLNYAMRVMYRIALRKARKAAGYQEHWSLAFVESEFDDLPLWRAQSIESPPGTYWADPFLFVLNGCHYCFVEEYDYEKARGHIAVLEYSDDAVRRIGEALVEPFHLSFPFIFEYDGNLYMCPETSEARQVRVYRCISFPDEWVHAATLMDNVGAADTMLFPHAGRWWLLTNMDRVPCDDYCNELRLYFGNDPLSDEWTPHPMNPIRVDSLGARNAGMYRAADAIYRFGQRQGFDLYGAGIEVFEIRRLDTDRYVESSIATIGAGFSRTGKGTHHLSSCAGLSVVDTVMQKRPHGFRGMRVVARRLGSGSR